LLLLNTELRLFFELLSAVINGVVNRF